MVDLQLLDKGLVFAKDKDALDHFWFRVRETDGTTREVYRVVKLMRLDFIPQEHRQEPGVLERMRAILVGLYNQRVANYDLVEVKAGIFDPPIGVIQMYGAIGIAPTYDEALRNADLGMAALLGSMANFEQSRLIPLTTQLALWLNKALEEFPHALVVIGQPEPRRGRRGMGREGPGERLSPNSPQPQDTLNPPQQAEMFLRTMAATREDFLAITLASRIPPKSLARMLAGISQEASIPASLMTGTESISVGLVLPIGLTEGLSRLAGIGYGQSDAKGVTSAVADSEVKSHIEGRADTVGHAVTDGTAETTGVATTSGSSHTTSWSVTEGSAHTEGTAHTTGKAHTEGTAHTTGKAHTVGSSVSTTTATTHIPMVVSTSTGTTQGSADQTSWQANITHTQGKAIETGTTRATNWQESTSQMHSTTDTKGAATSVGISPHVSVGGGVRAGATAGIKVIDVSGGVEGHMEIGLSTNLSHQRSVSHAETTGTTHSHAHGGSHAVSTSETASSSVAIGAGTGGAHTDSTEFSTGTTVTQPYVTISSSTTHTSMSSETTMTSDTRMVSDTTMTSDTTSKADTTSTSRTYGESHTSFSSVTHSYAFTKMHSETHSTATTTSVADGMAWGKARSLGTMRTSGTMVARSTGLSTSSMLAMGISPIFTLSRSYQWQNRQVAELLQILAAQEELLRQATLDGAYYTDFYVLTKTPKGKAAAEAAIRQAFQGKGPLVVTPIQTRALSPDQEKHIRLHAMCFAPCFEREKVCGALEAYRHTTLMLPEQLAAITQPALFEEGAAITVQEKIPVFAFNPNMEDGILIGYQVSHERGVVTETPFRIKRENFFHTIFSADTGFGKTVAAERLALESTLAWRFRTVVLDFGAGWRRLINAPIPPERVEVWQLFPGALVPFRWNPWEVGERLQPDFQLMANCEVFKNAGRMGPRQLGFMRRAAREMYLAHGVLTSDKEVWNDPKWNKVLSSEEEEAINAARRKKGLPEMALVGTHLSDLAAFERQALARYRSKKTDMAMWVDILKSYMPELERRRDLASMQSLEGVILRLEPFTQGELARMYGAGEGTIKLEELGFLGPPDDPWGISILEGGAELDDYSKAALLGLVAYRLYFDAVVRRREEIGKKPSPPLQIFFEEGNKIITGVETDTNEGRGQTTELFQSMWRDGRKYNIWLHVIVQTPSELPPGIMSSCNIGFFGQAKKAEDQSVVLAHLGFSFRGFVDEDYRRFLGRMPARWTIVKLGYDTDMARTTQYLIHPLIVPAKEPTDAEVYEHMKKLGKVQ